jgi:hypothetical protein
VRIEELKALVDGCVTGQRLELPAGKLGGAAGDVVRGWLGGAVVLTGVGVALVGKTVEVTGALAALGAGGSTAKVAFTIVDAAGVVVDDGVPAIDVTVPLPAGWTFGKGFPSVVGDTVTTLLGFPSGAEVVLTSVPRAASGGMPGLKAGEAGFTASGVEGRGSLARFVGLVVGMGLGLSGVLGSAKEGLRFALRSADVDAGEFGAKFRLDVSTTTDGGKAAHRVRLVADVTLPGVARFVPLAATLETGTSPVLYLTVGEPFEAKQASLEDLGKWTGSDPGKAVVSGFPLGSHVVVRSAWVALRPGKNLADVVAEVGVQVGLSGPWTIDPSFTVEQLWVSFGVTTPFAKPRALTAWAGGVGRLGDDVELDAGVVFTAGSGDPTAEVSLRTVKPVRLDELLRKAGVSLPEGTPTVALGSAAFSLAVPALSFTLSARSSVGPWSLGLGGATIALTSVSADLAHEKGAALTGALEARATVTPPGNGTTVGFGARWEPPTAFTLAGQVKNVPLTDLLKSLAAELDYTAVGLPKITLTEVGAAVTHASKDLYDLTLYGKVTVGSASVRFLAFAGKTTAATALLGVLWTDWKPPLPDVLVLTESGVALCTADGVVVKKSLIPNGVTLPAVFDAPLPKGVTCYARVDFAGTARDVLTALFGAPGSLTITGTLAVPVTNSRFTVVYGDRLKTGGLGFGGLVLVVDLAKKSFDLRAKFVVSFNGPDGKPERLSFAFGGALVLPTNSLSLYFLLCADDKQQELQEKLSGATRLPDVQRAAWKNPFDIKGLDVEDFYGAFGLDGTGGITVGMGGSVRIGPEGGQVALLLRVQGAYREGAPTVDVFIFDIDATHTPKHEITLGDLVRQFTSQTGQWLKVLDGFGLREFHLAIIIKIGGWEDPVTRKLYPRGFFTSGDLDLFGNTFKFDIRVYTNKGIDASGSIADPISWLDGAFTLSDYDGTKGPHAAVRTILGEGKKLVSLSAGLTLLAITTRIEAEAGLDGWTFRWETRVGEVFDIKMASTLGKSGFHGTFHLELDLRPITVVTGIVPLPFGSVLKDVWIKVDVTLGLSTVTLSLVLDGSAGIRSDSVSVHFSLDGLRDWRDLPKAIEDEAAKLPGEFFKWLVDDAEKWAKAIGDGVLKVAGDVAEILKSYFEVGAEEAARLLKLAGYLADDVVRYLKDLWKLSQDEAEELVKRVFKACAIASGAAKA